jgi:hypothetical protein
MNISRCIERLEPPFAAILLNGPVVRFSIEYVHLVRLYELEERDPDGPSKKQTSTRGQSPSLAEFNETKEQDHDQDQDQDID